MPLTFQCMVGSQTLIECAAIEYMARDRHQAHSRRLDADRHRGWDVFLILKRYFVTVLLMTDEWFNAPFGGYAEETISYRLAVNASKGGIVGRIACKMIQSVAPDDCTRTRWLQSELVRPISHKRKAR